MAALVAALCVLPVLLAALILSRHLGVRAAATTVTNANDSGPGSLRAAVAGAANGDTITFASSLNGTPIVLTSGEIDTGTSLTIVGNGASQTILDGNHTSRIFADTGGTVKISGVTIRNGRVALIGVNTSSAAGLLVEGGGTLTVSDSIVSGNAVVASANHAYALGGGVAALSGGHLTIVASTVTGNSATATAVGADAEGGGIEVDSSTSLSLINSTVSENAATTSGGGVANRGAAAATLTSSTIADNIAPTGSGLSHGFAVEASLVANAPSTNCFSGASSLGHNLDSGSSCGFTSAGDLSSTDPKLGPLQDNGGPTPTHALLAGSPALGGGGACPAADGGVDQRAQPRKAPCDIGAVEARSPVTPPPPPIGAPSPSVAPTPTPTPPPTAPSTPTSAGALGAHGASPGAAIPPPTAVLPGTSNGGRAPQGRGSCSPCPPHRSALVGSVHALPQVSTSTAVLLTNALLTLGLLVLIPFPSTLFNRTLSAHADEVRSWFRFIPARPALTRSMPGRGRGWVTFLVFVLAAAALYTQLDPGFGLNSPSLALYVGLVLALLVVTLGFSLPGVVHIHRAHGEAVHIRALPWTLLIASLCVGVSRLAHVHPGYVYGLTAGYVFRRRFSKKAEGRAAALSSAVLLLISTAAWLAWTPIRQSAGMPDAGFPVLVLDASLAMIFVAGLESLAFGLVPLHFLDGEKVIAWSRLAWGALFAAGVFGVLHVLLNPGSGYRATASGGTVVLLLLFAGFGALSVSLWAYFRFRPANGSPEPSDS